MQEEPLDPFAGDPTDPTSALEDDGPGRGVQPLTAEERQAIIAAFDQMRVDAKSPAFFENADEEDVHTLVIRKLKERAGGLADKIHTGRSRNDQVSLDIRLWLRDEIDTARGLLRDLMAALVAMARRDPDAIVVGYTHTRRAQPVLWPHYLLAYFEMFARDFERLTQARARVNVMPLGSGALAGSGSPDGGMDGSMMLVLALALGGALGGTK